jgi:hypothetical protein
MSSLFNSMPYEDLPAAKSECAYAALSQVFYLAREQFNPIPLDFLLSHSVFPMWTIGACSAGLLISSGGLPWKDAPLISIRTRCCPTDLWAEAG